MVSSKVSVGGILKALNKTERRVIIKAVKRFFDRHVDNEPFKSKLYGLEAALHTLAHYNKSKTYEPKDVFEVIYDRFGDDLFSQYTYSFSRSHPPTPEALHNPTLENLCPAAHYFSKSAALWEYGMQKFGLNADATDQQGNSALMMAVKHNEVLGAISMIQTMPTVQKRRALVKQQNQYGDTALKVAKTAAAREQTDEYQELIKLLETYT